MLPKLQPAVQLPFGIVQNSHELMSICACVNEATQVSAQDPRPTYTVRGSAQAVSILACRTTSGQIHFVSVDSQEMTPAGLHQISLMNTPYRVLDMKIEIPIVGGLEHPSQHRS